MGMSIGALSTMLQADRYLITDVPEEWSLEDAATVMVVYSTVLYAFKVVCTSSRLKQTKPLSTTFCFFPINIALIFVIQQLQLK